MTATATTARKRQRVRNRCVVAPAPAGLDARELHERLNGGRSKTFAVNSAVVADVPRRRVAIIDCEYTAVGADTRDLRQLVATAIGCDITQVVAPMRGEYVDA